jgi:hypothetical protein
MRIKQILVTVALASALLFADCISRSLAQSTLSEAARELAAPNNDAGSGGDHAPGTKVAGPHQPASAVSGIEEPNDESLTRAVRQMLASDAQTKDSNIQVTTHDGMVILHGRAKSSAAAKRAQALASQVSGVKGIEDQLDYPAEREQM